MSEKREYLSKRALVIIGILSLVILITGIILTFAGFNEAFYSDSTSTRAVFKAINYLGEPVLFIVIAAILYIGYNKKFAKNLALSLLFSYYVNGFFKGIIQDSRPNTNVDITEDYGYVEPSYGFPSGHTQNAVAFWGYVSYEFKDKAKSKVVPIIPTILSFLIFLVAISRIIIGVHDLEDIIGGLLCGIGLLLLFIYLEPVVSKQFNKFSFIIKIILAIIVSIGLFLIGILIFPSAGLGVVDSPPLYRDIGVFGQVCGVMLGFGIGYILEHEYIKYDPSELNNKKKIINVVLAIVILLVVFLPLEYILEIDSVFYRFARYAIVSFVLAFVVPLICTKINPKL